MHVPRPVGSIGHDFGKTCGEVVMSLIQYALLPTQECGLTTFAATIFKLFLFYGFVILRVDRMSLLRIVFPCVSSCVFFICELPYCDLCYSGDSALPCS